MATTTKYIEVGPTWTEVSNNATSVTITLDNQFSTKNLGKVYIGTSAPAANTNDFLYLTRRFERDINLSTSDKVFVQSTDTTPLKIRILQVS